MANKNKRRSENISGNYFVDSTCIDCGTCYWIAPENFERVGSMAAVISQPNNQNLENQVYRALLSCPVSSIGAETINKDLKDPKLHFPHLIDENVYHLGFHSENSYGAASYFIKDNKGNILIDSPRYVKVLEKAFNEMGGITEHLLSHKDDIADTDLYWESFKPTRRIHEWDKNKKSEHFEEFFTGEDVVDLFEDMTVIPVPGHTKGSVCFLYKEKYLFTGDHLAFSKDLNHLYAFKTACWYDFDKQIESMERLLDFDFEYVLPGHGRPLKASKKEMKDSLRSCIDWMKN